MWYLNKKCVEPTELQKEIQNSSNIVVILFLIISKSIGVFEKKLHGF